MQINKKLTILAVVFIIMACVINWSVYQSMAAKAKPEEKSNVVVLAKDLAAGSVLGKDDIVTVPVSASILPIGVATETKSFEGKRLLQSSHKGQFFFADMVADRGLQRIDTTKLFLIGIDVDNISNYLGCQLKPGEKYMLFDKSAGQPLQLCTVTIDKLVDSNGKDVTGSDSPVKTINVGVSTPQEMVVIMAKKGLKGLEIVRAPRP